MADKFKATIKQSNKENEGKPVDKMTSRVGNARLWPMDGIGRVYASKLFKAGFRSNNIDSNARHQLWVHLFVILAWMSQWGCYDDFEHGDAFVLWSSNMAEMNPIL